MLARSLLFLPALQVHSLPQCKQVGNGGLSRAPKPCVSTPVVISLVSSQLWYPPCGALLECMFISIFVMFPTFSMQEDQAELLEAAGLDPEALAALPPEMRREVLQQVRHRPNRHPPLPFPRVYVRRAFLLLFGKRYEPVITWQKWLCALYE